MKIILTGAHERSTLIILLIAFLLLKHAMRQRMTEREMGEGHIVFDLTDSTMNDMNAYMAKANEDERDIHGHVIQAVMQTNSRGSTDLKTGITREWKSQEGNLLFSMAVSIADIHQREVYLASALSVLTTIQGLNLGIQNLKMDIPNDIYIEGKKICGVLTSPEFCIGNWCNVGIGVNTAFAPKVTDGRNNAGCLRDYGWSDNKNPEEFLALFLPEFETHYQAQLSDPNYVFKELGLMNDEGLIYAYNRDNPHQWAVGQFVGFNTNDEGHDFILIKDVYDQIHRFFFLKTEILNPDMALKYYTPIVPTMGRHIG